MPPSPKTIPKPGTKRASELLGNLKILIYGQPGAGKTYFLGSASFAPEIFGKVLILCPDPGTLTLAFDDRMEEQCEIDIIQTSEQLDTWYEWLKVEMPKLPPEERFGTVCLDGYTDLSKMIMEETLKELHAQNHQRDPDKPDVDHHQRLGILARREIRRFRDLPVNFICTALEHTVTDSGTGKMYITPSAGGQMKSELPSYFEIVGYLYTECLHSKDAQGKLVETIVRRMRVQPDGKCLAKDRTRRLGSVIENPSLPDIVRTIKSTKDAVITAIIPADPKIKLPKFDPNKK